MVKITWYYRLLFASILTTSAALADDLPTTLGALEQYAVEHLADGNTADDQIPLNFALEQLDLQVWHTRLACIKAIGHVKFCHCISENIPIDQEFANYVMAVSKTKSELNYDQLDRYYQQIIDLARSSRDKCVAETM